MSLKLRRPGYAFFCKSGQNLDISQKTSRHLWKSPPLALVDWKTVYWALLECPHLILIDFETFFFWPNIFGQGIFCWVDVRNHSLALENSFGPGEYRKSHFRTLLLSSCLGSSEFQSNTHPGRVPDRFASLESNWKCSFFVQLNESGGWRSSGHQLKVGRVKGRGAFNSSGDAGRSMPKDFWYS